MSGTFQCRRCRQVVQRVIEGEALLAFECQCLRIFYDLDDDRAPTTATGWEMAIQDANCESEREDATDEVSSMALGYYLFSALESVAASQQISANVRAKVQADLTFVRPIIAKLWDGRGLSLLQPQEGDTGSVKRNPLPPAIGLRPSCTGKKFWKTERVPRGQVDPQKLATDSGPLQGRGAGRAGARQRRPGDC